jgi:pimeloyl-ACP methyl ester carboxylesterase
MAPDVRGYGRSGGSDVKYDDSLDPFRSMNKVRDMLALVSAFGYRSLHVVGHDQGSPLAGWCALARPDVFRSVVMSSAPFGGAPTLPFNTADAPPRPATAAPPDRIYDELAALKPPRKHYQRYYQTREANENLWHPPQGVHAFMRAYYHMKSADWTANQPHPLQARTAAEWAKLPRYYVMDLDKGMAETVAAERRGHRSQQMAAGQRAPRLRRGVRSYWVSGWAERLPHRCGAGGSNLRRSHHRRPRHLHRRQERLGRVSESRSD